MRRSQALSFKRQKEMTKCRLPLHNDFMVTHPDRLRPRRRRSPLLDRSLFLLDGDFERLRFFSSLSLSGLAFSSVVALGSSLDSALKEISALKDLTHHNCIFFFLFFFLNSTKTVQTNPFQLGINWSVF